jgi:hypothetical protein
MVDAKYYSELAHLFSPPILGEIASSGSSGFLDYVLEHSGYSRQLQLGTTFEELFEGIYAFLLRHYRCEYIYKNALANKILLGRHSLTSSTLLTEFSTGESKADLVILNGSSTVYEIKTELDSLERLQRQLDSYLTVFDNIYVVTCASNLKRLGALLNDRIGILLLSNRYTLSTIRIAKSNKDETDPIKIFDCLRQTEYCDVIQAAFGAVPVVPNTRIYSECRKLFATLKPQEAHDRMVKAISRRRQRRDLKLFIRAVPHSLRLLSLISKLTCRERDSFLTTLKSVYI